MHSFVNFWGLLKISANLGIYIEVSYFKYLLLLLCKKIVIQIEIIIQFHYA